MTKGTSSAPLGHLLHEGVEKGLVANIVPSPTKLEKVDRAKPETDEVHLVTKLPSHSILP